MIEHLNTVVFQFRDTDEPVVSHYELQGDTVVLQMDAVSAGVLFPSTTLAGGVTSCLLLGSLSGLPVCGIPGEEQVCGERNQHVRAQHLRASGQR